MVRTVAGSSSPMRRLKPWTSALRMALRRRSTSGVSGMWGSPPFRTRSMAVRDGRTVPHFTPDGPRARVVVFVGRAVQIRSSSTSSSRSSSSSLGSSGAALSILGRAGLTQHFAGHISSIMIPSAWVTCRGRSSRTPRRARSRVPARWGARQRWTKRRGVRGAVGRLPGGPGGLTARGADEHPSAPRHGSADRSEHLGSRLLRAGAPMAVFRPSLPSREESPRGCPATPTTAPAPSPCCGTDASLLGPQPRRAPASARRGAPLRVRTIGGYFGHCLKME